MAVLVVGEHDQFVFGIFNYMRINVICRFSNSIFVFFRLIYDSERKILKEKEKCYSVRLT